MSAKEKESYLYSQRVMKKGKKRHWGFTCPNCKKKFSSKDHTEYFLIQWDGISTITGILKEEWTADGLFCSKPCLLTYMEKDGPIINDIYKELDDWEKKVSKLSTNWDV